MSRQAMSATYGSKADKKSMPASSSKARPSRRREAPVDGWQVQSRLFPPLAKDIQNYLERFPIVLEKARPLKAQFRKDLPRDIETLSRQLTNKRASLKLPYWSNPASLSAYLYYFLPWNLIRMCRLLGGLQLPNPASLANPAIIDAGSGPLTLPIALWLAKPEWREIPLHIIAADPSAQALKIGKTIFRELSGPGPWRISLLNSPLDKQPRLLPEILGSNETPFLLTFANVLNELASRHPVRHKDDISEREDKQDSLYERLIGNWQDLAEKSEHLKLLFVEPGTRLGGNAIMQIREAALAENLYASAPCTHNKPCPLLNSGRHGGSLTSAWCHFTFLPIDVPLWLIKLSEAAHLTKQSLSISFLLLQKNAMSQSGEGLPVRALSQPFKAAGIFGEARYGCANCGLAVLENARNVQSGDLVHAKEPRPEKRDSKHGLPVLQPFQTVAKN